MKPHDPTFWERQKGISVIDLILKDFVMKKFIGVKVIKGKPMTLGEYNKYRGWIIPENEDPDKLGYLVEYPPDPSSEKNHPDHEGYISWSPKEVFDKAYHKLKGLTFGFAIEALKMGLRVAREGWNGKDMYLTLVQSYPVNGHLHSVRSGDNKPTHEEKLQDMKVPELNPDGTPNITQGNPGQMLSHIVMKTNGDSKYWGEGCSDYVPWLASQTDILAEDYFIVE